ncbi:MAG: SRPBCC family protein [Ardenticatenales bacterium]|nr:SRPBCC family protein [Ardenticatenales bacterium]
MTQITASATINAPAEKVYGILADYREGHPRILPTPYFQGLQVEQGGVGAGTVIRFQMKVMGSTRQFRAAITEPEPGKVLVETDLDTGGVTTFTVVEQGTQARVTITTELKGRGGLLGKLEGFMTRMLLQPIYTQELVLLASVAEQRNPNIVG